MRRRLCEARAPPLPYACMAAPSPRSLHPASALRAHGAATSAEPKPVKGPPFRRPPCSALLPPRQCVYDLRRPGQPAHITLNPKVALANRLGLRPRQVEVWFQNRCARTKLKQTEVDCEYLKRWCERLADENKRLEKELADLRALKAAPSPASALQSSYGAAPVATLTMCPSCRRVATAGAPPPNQQWHPKSNIPTATAPAVAGNVLPSHCQFFPAAADRTSQSTWNAAAPLVTRELF